MEHWMHGGDIYRNTITYDFSVNVNPLGVPNGVRQAMLDAVAHCDRYPDLHVQKVREAIGKYLHVSRDCILCGNGASELIMATFHALQPKKVVIPVPSFYGYEYATNSGMCDVIYYPLQETKGFAIGDSIFEVLQEDVDLLLLASPNNPTGKMILDAQLIELLEWCKQRNIFVLLDQCFVDFVDAGIDMARQINDVRALLVQYPNLMLLRAFTKTFCIPGVRLGYLMCEDDGVRKRIARQLPEWNVSYVAQAAGEAACKEREYVSQSRAYVKQEREWLMEQLQAFGFICYESAANYVLFFSDIPLYDALLKQGILIRDCSNYRGLRQGFYRIAVRSREENERLCEAIRQCIEL
ncbi:MAG: histidinol-phosphate transaminase [Eubacteriales bacterium]|nr:histidinol-phosphate transaminase [Eubacteriales bacterium]